MEGSTGQLRSLADYGAAAGAGDALRKRRRQQKKKKRGPNLLCKIARKMRALERQSIEQRLEVHQINARVGEYMDGVTTNEAEAEATTQAQERNKSTTATLLGKMHDSGRKKAFALQDKKRTMFEIARKMADQVESDVAETSGATAAAAAFMRAHDRAQGGGAGGGGGEAHGDKQSRLAKKAEAARQKGSTATL